MADEPTTEEVGVAIYVLPSEEGVPPRATLTMFRADTNTPIGQNLATWSSDMGCWTIEGQPVDQEIGDAITEHAKNLGVKWD